jgi:cytoskeleton protein RodZ
MHASEDNEVKDPDADGNRISIGKQLSAARTKQQLTSGKVARELNLSEAVIKSIEADDAASLPAPIYVQGYVRSYARLLGLPEEELVRNYSNQYCKPPPLTVSGRTRRLPLVRLPPARLIRNIILVLLAVILLWLAYPFVANLIELRDTSAEQQVPGRLELPPAEESVNPD